MVIITRNISFLLIILLFHQNTFGQLPDSLKKYYTLVNKAELAIVDSDYSLALTHYRKAFTFNATPFKKDIYNEAVCAVLLKDYAKAFCNFKILSDYGYQIDSLISKKEFINFFNSKYGKRLIKYGEKK